MKITLISPAVYRHQIKPFWLPPLSLTTIASVTPEDIEVTIIDENVEQVDFNIETDLVGITVLSAMANRAYEIASQFKKRGIKIIMGGFHASAMPEEALNYADSVVIGEVEDVWSDVLSDFKSGQLKRIYSTTELPILDNLPLPRRDLLKKRAYLSTSTVQTAKGCPFNCEFCSIASLYQGKFRYKPVNRVIEDIKTLDRNFLFLVDDNIVGNLKRARELFKALAPINIKWWSQASVNIKNDEEVIKLAANSGCFLLIIGVETLSQKNLTNIGKKVNKVDDYEAFIELMHKHNIMLNLSFVFGLDGDEEDVFEKTIEFLRRTKVSLATFNVQTPYPGTRLYQRFLSEGRIIDHDWSKYDGGHVVYQPTNMSPEALQEGYDWAVKKFYSHEVIRERVQNVPRSLSNIMFQWNMGYKKMLDAFGVAMG